MVTPISTPNPNDDDADPADLQIARQEDLEDLWQDRLDRRERRRQAKQRSKRTNRRIVVDADRLVEPDTQRMSRALLALRRQLNAAADERAARAGDDDRRAGRPGVQP